MGKVTGFIYCKPNCQPCRLTELVADPERWTIHTLEDGDPMFDRLREEGYQQMPVVQVFTRTALLTTWTGFRPDKLNYWNKVVSK